jgi:ribonuclease HI
VRLERAGCTIGPKSQFCIDGISIVGFVCGAEGWSPDSAKVIKILEWKPCTDVGEARAFIGVCVYYRIWIKDFSVIAEPIYYLFKKGVPWNWGLEQDRAMDTLKHALTHAPALVRIIYTDKAGEVILGVDASLKGWGAVLMQLDDQGRRHPSRYESGLWNTAEQNYDATKRECRGVLKALRKVRYWLYGVRFTLETDASVLVAQLNRSATDLPGALVTRWIAYIRLFDFTVRHVPGTKHTAADGLSRRLRTESDDIDEANEVDINDFIDAELNAFSVALVAVEDALTDLLTDGYSEDSWQIARYLTTLQKLAGMGRTEFRSFKRRALQYAVTDGNLYRRAGKGVPQRLVIDTDDCKAEILKELHEEFGHKGRESTYRRVADCYYWDNCYKDVQEFVASCDRC